MCLCGLDPADNVSVKCRDFNVAGIEFKFHSTRQLVTGMTPNTDDHAREVLNKSNLTEIVTRSHKITEMYDVACGLRVHLLPCGLPLFTVSYFTGKVVRRSLVGTD
jgi:hypothetical protein